MRNTKARLAQPRRLMGSSKGCAQSYSAHSTWYTSIGDGPKVAEAVPNPFERKCSVPSLVELVLVGATPKAHEVRLAGPAPVMPAESSLHGAAHVYTSVIRAKRYAATHGGMSPGPVD